MIWEYSLLLSVLQQRLEFHFAKYSKIYAGKAFSIAKVFSKQMHMANGE